MTKLARYAGFETLPPPWRALEDLTRRLHAPYGELARRAAPPLAAEDRRASEVSVAVPLDAAAWSRVLGRPVTLDSLVAEILADRRAAWLYRGLAVLDDELLRALRGDPEALRRLYREGPETWAVFARALQGGPEGLAVPGGREARPLWERAVGESAGRPARFAAALMSLDGGRLAWLYDVAARLDPPRQRFLLGLELPTEERLPHWKRVQARLVAEPDWWRALRPMSRPWPDAEAFVRALQLDEHGRLSLPLGAGPGPVPDGGPGPGDVGVRAADLLDWALSGDPGQRARHLLRLTYAQRAWSDSEPAPATVRASALDVVERRPLLALTLEIAGVTAPPDLTAAAAKAARLEALPRALGLPATLSYQAALAMLAQGRRSGGLSVAEARAAVTSLLALPPQPCALAAWLRHVAGEAPDGWERRWIERLSGPDPAGAEIEWDGLRYRVAPATAERMRLEAWRRLQGGPSLDQALQACGEGGSSAAQAAARLGEVLRGFVYARSLGWPDQRGRASAALAARHDLEWGASGPERGPWSAPGEEQLPGQPRRVRGGLLGLELALAPRRLRRLSDELPLRPPKLQQDYRLPLAWRAAGLQVRASLSGASSAVAEAMRRGRQRLAEAGLETERLDALAREGRLPAWRRRVLPWLALRAPEELPLAFLPAELARLGGLAGRRWAWSPHPFEALLGPCRPLADTPEDVRGLAPGAALPAATPDLELRLLELLHEAHVDESLAPALLPSLVQQFIDSSQPVGLDDAESWQREAAALGLRQVEDHVSALVELGALQPIFEAGPR